MSPGAIFISCLTPGKRMLRQKLTVLQLVKKSPPFTGPKCSLLCSQENATGP